MVKIIECLTSRKTMSLRIDFIGKLLTAFAISVLTGCIARPKVYIYNDSLATITVIYYKHVNTDREVISIKSKSEGSIEELYLHREIDVSKGETSFYYFGLAEGVRIYGPDSFGAKLARERKNVAFIFTESGEIYAAAKKGMQIEKLVPQPEGFPIKAEKKSQ